MLLDVYSGQLKPVRYHTKHGQYYFTAGAVIIPGLLRRCVNDRHANPWPIGEFSHSEDSSVLAAGGPPCSLYQPPKLNNHTVFLKYFINIIDQLRQLPGVDEK